jgi:uncharacterized protein (TIGR03435 family)
MAFVATGLALLAATALAGQSRLAFEVASVKPTPVYSFDLVRAGKVYAGSKVDGARADFGAQTFESLLCSAYGVEDYQISGPDWMKTARFDIAAKLPAGATAEQVPEMLRTLLEERFHLAVHRDSREFPVYALVVGKYGLKLQARPADYQPTPTGTIRPRTMENLVQQLSFVLRRSDRPVVDQTGLKGEYLVDADVIRRGFQQLDASLRARPAANGTPVEQSDAPGPDIFGAIQTFGLKLEPRKLPILVLVVDRAEKTPTEN